MQILEQFKASILIGICGSLLFVSCEELPISGGSLPQPPSTPTDLDLDRISEFLVLHDAQRISGNMGSAPDGMIKIDVADTLYSVLGYPLGNRIDVKKQPFQDITGYYVGIPGASFYYDVPERIIEGQFQGSGAEDTSSVIELDLDPGIEELAYPFSVDIVIQPHDPSGQPLDEFNRTITVEDPADAFSAGGCNTITYPIGNGSPHWDWEFTIREYNGEILNVLAPYMGTQINSIGAGCCNSQGQSFTTSSSPACDPSLKNNPSPHMRWVELEVRDFSYRPFEWLWFFNDGSVKFQSWNVKKQYHRAGTNFCTEEVAYTFELDGYGNEGTHDFMPGSNYVNLSWPNWEGGWRPLNSEVIYTCHTLIRIWGVDDKFSAVYKRFRSEDFDPDFLVDYHKPWFE